MAPDEKSLQDESFVVERDGGMLYTYANNVNLDWTVHDIRFRFAELVLMPEYRQEKGKYRVEERVSVATSWSEAKSLYILLGRVIGEYERLNGPIQFPVAPGKLD